MYLVLATQILAPCAHMLPRVPMPNKCLASWADAKRIQEIIKQRQVYEDRSTRKSDPPGKMLAGKRFTITNLKGANFRSAMLAGADLRGGWFGGCRLTGVIWGQICPAQKWWSESWRGHVIWRSIGGYTHWWR